MEESAPAAAPPPDDATAAEETRKDKPVPERRRFHVPTSLLVTILLAIVSVWIAPALTRQWEDRQKERELKAEIIDEVTTRTAQTMGKTVAAEEATKSTRGLETEWDVFRSRTEANLLTYFPIDVARQWADVAELIARWVSFAPSGREGEDTERAYLMKALGLDPSSGDLDPGECIHGCIVLELERALRQRVNRFTAVLLRANSDVFSTTRRDLFQDLLPSFHSGGRNKVDEKISRKLGYDVSGCSVTDELREGKQYECNVDYSVESVYVLIDHDGYVYPL
jgi:hypothetical protein